MKAPELEILIATMNRTTLDFLYRMFRDAELEACAVLIINQTTEDQLLKSPNGNIRVINSFEKGLSKSRNLAIANAIGEICLVADDDVCFLPEFQQRIKEAYANHPEAAVICFQTLTPDGSFYSNYAGAPKELTRRNIKKILSIEVSFKPGALREKAVIFNEWFGLGGIFEDAETFFFLREVIAKKVKALYYPAPVGVHKMYSSSDAVETDRVVRARTAAYYKAYKGRAYFLLMKYVVFLWRKGYITLREMPGKVRTGLKGIRDFKYLTRVS